MVTIDIAALQATTNVVKEKRALEEKEKERNEQLAAQAEADKIIATIPDICKNAAGAGEESAVAATISHDLDAWGSAQGRPVAIYCKRSGYGKDNIQKTVLPCYPLVYEWCKNAKLNPEWIYTASGDEYWCVRLRVSW